MDASWREVFRGASRVVAFSGAGMSAESGIATFRGAGGLWESYRPEDLATPRAFDRHPDVVWRWYRARHERVAAARPNAGHLALARWEAFFPSLVVVTQNVDRLHQAAGSSAVLELHGTLREGHCERCGRREAMADLLARGGEPPRCGCGGRFRPSVVWFGEDLPWETFVEAQEAARAAEVFLAIGTSALVYPAAGLIEVAAASGARVIEVNREPTPLSELADLVLTGASGEVLPRLTTEIEACRAASR